jgi:uncharacterized membrane protein YagU involved in acid resistance
MSSAGRLARGAVLGLVGGLVAAGAMTAAHRLASAITPEAEAPSATKEKDSTVKVASAVTRQAGYQLPEQHESRAGAIVHYAFGASVGALYGLVAELVPRVTAFLGLPFGVAVWLGAHVVAVPALDLAEPPTRRPVRQEAEEFGLHVVYGMTAEIVRRLLSLRLVWEV